MHTSKAIARKHVLLAEDDTDAREVLAAFLRGLGLDVFEVPDGGRMLVAITAQYRAGLTPNDIDLIVTDLSMPVINGLDVCKALRAAHCKTPVIIVTGRNDPEVEDAAVRLAAVIVHKPIDLAELEATVTRLLSMPPSSRQPDPCIDGDNPSTPRKHLHGIELELEELRDHVG